MSCKSKISGIDMVPRTGEGGAAHEVIDGLSVDGEARSSVRHHALALSAANLGAQVGLR